jgi:hypothetical protein
MTESVIKEELYNQERLAVALGWTSIDANGLTGIPPGERLLKLIPRWYSDLNDAHKLGEAIEERGLVQQWLSVIYSHIQDTPGRWKYGAEYAFLRVDADILADAALAVLEANHRKKNL